MHPHTPFRTLGKMVLGLAAAATLAAPPASAQVTGPLTTVNGRVVDLTRDLNGELLYVAENGDVGRIGAGASVTILANAATGPFPNPLKAIAQTPNGDIYVVDSIGDLYRMPGGTAPATRVYTDFFMVANPTDMIADASGNLMITSDTPTSGAKSLSWISADGVRWGYYLVKHGPIALCVDPLTGNLIMADQQGGGTLRLVDVFDGSHPTSPLDTSTFYGFVAGFHDGDLAPESNGNVLVAAGTRVRRYLQGTGGSSIVAQGFPQLHALTVAPSSGNLASPSGFSAYVSHGEGPSTITEIADVAAPGAVIAGSLGQVPGPGLPVNVSFGAFNAFELSVDTSGDLLIGGDNFGTNPAVKRIGMQSLAVTTISGAGSGITDRVEGLVARADGAIFALSNQGNVFRIVESPFSVTNVFNDPANQIGIGKDLVLDRSGALFAATHQGVGSGRIVKIADGVGTVLAAPREARGACADPFSGDLIVSEWVNTGFAGTAQLCDGQTGALTPLPGYGGVNIANGGVWGDGDVVQDVEGNIYECAEDEWTVWRYQRSTGKMFRFGSGYLFRPSGLLIAPSTPSSGSVTGWSLYVLEFTRLWEVPGVPAPAPRVADTSAPPVGRLVGWMPSWVGTPRAMVADPAGNGFFVSTSNGTIERIASNGAATTVANGAQGLIGDLTALAPNPFTGRILAAASNGNIFELDPGAGFAASPLFADPANDLHGVESIVVDGVGRVLIVDRDHGPTAGRVFALGGSTLEVRAITARGVGGAIDPLTADLFVTEQGSWLDGAGEILRVDMLSPTPASGHYRGESFFELGIGPRGGGIAFASNGDFYVAAGDDGRVVKFERASGARIVVAGGYSRPVSLALAPGTPGVAGPQGTSLFVLDGHAIYEVGVDGLPAGPPPVMNPGLADRADLMVHGFVSLGAPTSISIHAPLDAGGTYVVLPSVSGKLPGMPASVLGGDFSDGRIIPNNPDAALWPYVNAPGVMPGFVGVLDGLGNGDPSMAIHIPNTPAILIGTHIDLVWIRLDLGFPNLLATIGGTAQMYLGL